MLLYSDSTVFNVNADVLCNAVNCQGVMGAGIAHEFKLRFPAMFADYIERCSAGSVRVGEPYLYHSVRGPSVLNFPTKKGWRQPSRLEWIREGLEALVEQWDTLNISSLALPPLGCGKGGLAGENVFPLMERWLGALPGTITICLNRQKDAEGTERQMLKYLGGLSLLQFQALGISKRTFALIAERKELRRFHDLAKIKGMGVSSYEKLFAHCYSQVMDESPQLDFLE